ncbi:D-alanyl-D-alanine carboxypeptidase/D-alanyl-D-alanine-endopeptidase [bacterium]|nr:D-alanyl-D-alanine carboxypeptidase/D-alanyl-D-alanine-endopeptidase [bacterium]
MNIRKSAIVTFTVLTLYLSYTSSNFHTLATDDSINSLKIRLGSIASEAQNIEKTKVSIYVESLDNGRIIFSQDGGQAMVPASNLKIVTTATALSMLGPYYRLRTELRAPSPDEYGVIKGNLYLRGGGDPTTTPPYDDPNTAPYKYFIDKLKEAGVNTIEGDLVADDSAFNREFLPQGWKDEYRLDAYSAPVGGLSFNGNMVEIVLEPGSAKFNPPCPTMGIKFINSDENPHVERPKGSNTVEVHGTYTSNVRNQLCVEDPPLFAIGVFKELLDRNHITVKGKVRLVSSGGEAATVESLRLYATHYSPPVSEIVHEINHESDNLFAEHLYKTVGRLTAGQGTAQSGFQACKEFMSANNINWQGINMVDGSGLSPLDRISPRQLVSILRTMDRSIYRSWYKESLPHSGRGTLRGRLGGVDVRAKTGTLANDSSLSGYVMTAAGQELAFSIILNDTTIWNAVNTQNRIVQTLSSWPDRL